MGQRREGEVRGKKVNVKIEDGRWDRVFPKRKRKRKEQLT